MRGEHAVTVTGSEVDGKYYLLDVDSDMFFNFIDVEGNSNWMREPPMGYWSSKEEALDFAKRVGWGIKE